MRFFPLNRTILALAVFTLLTLGFTPGTGAAQKQTRLRDLPVQGQYALSASLGRDNPAYHIQNGGDGALSENPAQHLTARFLPGGIEVKAGKGTWGLTLSAWGYGRDLRPVAPAKTTTGDNRLEYKPGTCDRVVRERSPGSAAGVYPGATPFEGSWGAEASPFHGRGAGAGGAKRGPEPGAAGSGWC